MEIRLSAAQLAIRARFAQVFEDEELACEHPPDG